MGKYTKTGNASIENVRMERKYDPGRPITLAEQLAAEKERIREAQERKINSPKKTREELNQEWIAENFRKTHGIRKSNN